MLVEREVRTTKRSERARQQEPGGAHSSDANAKRGRGFRVLSNGACSQPERCAKQHECQHGQRNQSDPDQWVLEDGEQTSSATIRTKAGNTRRVRCAVERKTQKESSCANDQQVDGNTDHHLIGAKAKCCQRKNE